MRFDVHSSNRCCRVVRVKRFDLRSVQRDLMLPSLAQGEFSVIDAAIPAIAGTSFRVYDDGRRILIAVCLRDLIAPGRREPGSLRESVEILFNPWNDGIGFQQFLISPVSIRGPFHFTPYEFAHSTAFMHMRVVKTKWILPAWLETDKQKKISDGLRGLSDRDKPAWLFAWFDADDVFRNTNVVGFNLARISGDPAESSSWNPCRGHGMPDAGCFGRLYRNTPTEWADDIRIEHVPFRYSRHDSRVPGKKRFCLRISGNSASRKRLAFRLLDPLGEPVAFEVYRNGGSWELRASLDSAVPGRYRLYGEIGKIPMEPRYIAFDLEPEKNDRPFSVIMTYDVPDDILCEPFPYTPDALGSEFDLMREHGISRIHWIDYPPETLYSPRWLARGRNALCTRRYCGDMLPLAASLARGKGMEFIGVFKPFDIAMDLTNRSPVWDEAAVPGHNARNLEGRNLWLPRDIAKGQAAVMSVNPDWHSESDARSPVRIRFYSREPLPVLKPGDLRLWVSPDNRRYRLYRGAFKWNVSRVRRAHQRWTAAGNIEEPGKAARFMLEISDVKLRSPFMALELGKDIRLVERAHAFAEAWDGQGNAVPVTLATAGDREKGFSYWQEWVGWGNTSPRMLEDVCWGAGMHGLVFRMRRAQPTLLEPCCEEAHEIWLGRLRRILDTDADGVCIRTLCHHNNVMDYMMMAFAPAVRERFRLEHGRDPEPGWNDAVLVRRLRGLAYTEFLRKAKQLAVKSGKKLALHFESGVEVPVSCDQRMQFNLEWEKWITEGIADELVLKLWFAGNPFIHERVLPLARRHDIPVYIVDRNSSLRNTPRAIERAGSLLRASRRAGFDGFAWYETCDYKRRNAQNVPEFRAHAGDAIRLSAAL